MKWEKHTLQMRFTICGKHRARDNAPRKRGRSFSASVAVVLQFPALSMQSTWSYMIAMSEFGAYMRIYAHTLVTHEFIESKTLHARRENFR